MAQQKGIINLRGKVGDMVYTIGKHGKRVRSAPTLTAEQKKAKAELPQNKKTAVFNALASTINSAVAHYASVLKPGNFYSKLHSIFRGENSDERTILLRPVQQVEINERYAFHKACPYPTVEVTVEKNAYLVDAAIEMPRDKYRDNNSFSLEFIMLVFCKGSNSCRHSAKYSSWMLIKDRKPKYLTFRFPREAKDTDYLLACRAVFAVNCNEDGYWSSAVMRFFAGNAVTRKGLKLLADHAAARHADKTVKETVVEKERVAVREIR